MSTTTAHQGLPEGMQPFALLELIESLRPELDLKDQDIKIRTSRISVGSSDMRNALTSSPAESVPIGYLFQTWRSSLVSVHAKSIGSKHDFREAELF